MALTIYIILFWLLLALFVFEEKNIDNKGMAFTFMVGVFLNTHVLFIIHDPFKWIKITSEPIPYIGFVLYRSFFTPLLITYMMNLIFKKDRTWHVVASFMMAILSFWVTEALNVELELITYKKWIGIYTVSYLFGLLLLCYFFIKWFKRKGWV
jgi:hypothetical protein